MMRVGSGARGRKSIFVTGAARGIGRATLELFAEQGWFVAGYDLDAEGLESIEAALGSDRCLTRVLDVRDKGAWDEAMAEFSEHTDGRLDILFNNAGIGGGGWFEDVPYERAIRIIEVNLIGVMNGVYAGLPLLKNTPGSLCLSTSSAAGIYGMPRVAAYSASKAAVCALTEALSAELHRCGVRAADVVPGVIDTPILDETFDYTDGQHPGVEMRAAAAAQDGLGVKQPEDVARIVLEAYASERLHWYVPEELGQVAVASGTAPEALREAFRKQLAERC